GHARSDRPAKPAGPGVVAGQVAVQAVDHQVAGGGQGGRGGDGAPPADAAVGQVHDLDALPGDDHGQPAVGGERLAAEQAPGGQAQRPADRAGGGVQPGQPGVVADLIGEHGYQGTLAPQTVDVLAARPGPE